jgi:hypothetical protein
MSRHHHGRGAPSHRDARQLQPWQAGQEDIDQREIEAARFQESSTLSPIVRAMDLDPGIPQHFGDDITDRPLVIYNGDRPHRIFSRAANAAVSCLLHASYAK